MDLNGTQFGRAASQLQYEHGQEHPDWVRQNTARRSMGADVPTIMDRHIQRQLFDPADIPPMEAHHQLPHEFAADPRTWFHGRIMKAGQTKAPKGRSSEGFHAGSRPSAVQRLSFNDRRRGTPEGMVGRLFPLRATGDFEEGFRQEPEPKKNPYRKGGGSIRHTDLGGAEKGYRYKNVVEDSGSISIGAPQRAGFLSTHREMVAATQARGEHVQPVVAWAAKHHPEHTGEVMTRHKTRDRSEADPRLFWPGVNEK